ncbi:unnamed protein product [Callosobruchus maculatus]|nr:unnamed protein product [Callosobruchus maculatus]
MKESPRFLSYNYPFTFEPLLLTYIFLECKVLYNRESYSQKTEQLVEDRILRLLLIIYSAYLRHHQVPADKIFGESAKAIVKLCVQFRQCYDVNHTVIENIVVKLLAKTGQLKDALTLTNKHLPSSIDSSLKDPSDNDRG